MAGINDDEAGVDVESSLRTSPGKDLADYAQQRALVPVVESPLGVGLNRWPAPAGDPTRWTQPSLHGGRCVRCARHPYRPYMSPAC